MKSILSWLRGLPMTKTEPELQQAIYHALSLHEAGKLKEAKSTYRKLLRRHPDNPDILHLSGLLLRQMGQTDAAIDQLTRAASLVPESFDVHLHLFQALASAQKVPEIESTLRILEGISPNDAYILAQLGEVLVRQDQSGEAEPYFRRSLEEDPSTISAWNGLGTILERRGKFAEAEECFRKSIELEPDRAESHYNLGNVLRQQNQIENSINALIRAVTLDPEFKLAHVHLAFSLFMDGQYTAAWPEYEWRWKIPNFPTPERPFRQPKWSGEPLSGKRILVHAEQGFGDTIQFARFVENLVEQGGEVIIECPPALTNLMKSTSGVSQVLARGDALPEFDIHVPLLSIPGILSMDLNDIPKRTPYLHAPDHVQIAGLGQTDSPELLKIGITWQTSKDQLSSSFKSCPLQAYTPLFDLKHVTWISLQKEISETDQPLPSFLMDISQSLGDFADTAAAIEQLDLVISMDTAVAHLAGALGKPVWLLLSTAGDWRWMVDRDDSPWYPTMRIFRQTQFGNWESVFRQLVPILKDICVEN
jgi:tetratricopeptide (TPR) repeat protein